MDAYYWDNKVTPDMLFHNNLCIGTAMRRKHFQGRTIFIHCRCYIIPNKDAYGLWSSSQSRNIHLCELLGNGWSDEMIAIHRECEHYRRAAEAEKCRDFLIYIYYQRVFFLLNNSLFIFFLITTIIIFSLKYIIYIFNYERIVLPFLSLRYSRLREVQGLALPMEQ